MLFTYLYLLYVHCAVKTFVYFYSGRTFHSESCLPLAKSATARRWLFWINKTWQTLERHGRLKLQSFIVHHHSSSSSSYCHSVADPAFLEGGCGKWLLSPSPPLPVSVLSSLEALWRCKTAAGRGCGFLGTDSEPPPLQLASVHKWGFAADNPLCSCWHDRYR